MKIIEVSSCALQRFVYAQLPSSLNQHTVCGIVVVANNTITLSMTDQAQVFFYRECLLNKNLHLNLQLKQLLEIFSASHPDLTAQHFVLLSQTDNGQMLLADQSFNFIQLSDRPLFIFKSDDVATFFQEKRASLVLAIGAAMREAK